MDIEKLKEKILTIIPDAVAEENKQFPACVIPAAGFHSLCQTLKDDPELAFDLLLCVSGVDWGKELGVTYHLSSTTLKHELVLKVKTEDRENPVFDTVADLWMTAEFHEREVYDMFGIRFNGHPDLRRMFLDESWVGYPLRKDYVDEVNIVQL